MTVKNWTTIAESSYPWEREALEFIRAQFPTHDPYRAWTNFEFIADDGSVNEIDLLVFTPHGFFLIEIKSRPGRLWGDAGTWTWETFLGTARPRSRRPNCCGALRTNPPLVIRGRMRTRTTAGATRCQSPT